MTKKEMAEVFGLFLKETGNYYRFKSFVEGMGVLCGRVYDTGGGAM